jgi:hypothetical protein
VTTRRPVRWTEAVTVSTSLHSQFGWLL